MSNFITSPAYDIAQLLEDQGVGVMAQDIFVGNIPQEIDTCIGVFDNGGTTSLNVYQRDEMLVRFQIRSPINDYNTGYNLANSVKEAVLGCESVTINEKDYILFNLVGDINHLGLDDLNRHRFSLNLRVVRENFGGSRLPF